MTPVGFEPTQLALVELESTPLDHSGKVSCVLGPAEGSSLAHVLICVAGLGPTLNNLQSSLRHTHKRATTQDTHRALRPALPYFTLRDMSLPYPNT